MLGATFPPLADPDAADPASVEALSDYRDACRARARLEREFERHLSPAALALYRELSDATTEEHAAAELLHVQEFGRHLPGYRPAIRLLWAHVIDCRSENVGQCYAGNGPVEP